MGTQRIDGLDTHTVQAHRLLESLRVVLTTSIQHTDGLDELALGDASSVVANGDTQVVVDIDFNAVACLHLELVDTVVYHLLQQYIDAVFGQRAVAQSADIHTRAGTDMFHIRQMADIVVRIFYLLVFNDCILFAHRFFL